MDIRAVLRIAYSNNKWWMHLLCEMLRTSIKFILQFLEEYYVLFVIETTSSELVLNGNEQVMMFLSFSYPWGQFHKH